MKAVHSRNYVQHLTQDFFVKKQHIEKKLE